MMLCKYFGFLQYVLVDAVGNVDIFQLLPLNCKKKREMRNISIFATDYYNLIYGRIQLKQVKSVERINNTVASDGWRIYIARHFAIDIACEADGSVLEREISWKQ